MKHNTIEWHRERIDRVQDVADRLKTPVGILIDLQGPELRIETPGQRDFPVEQDEIIKIVESFPYPMPVSPKRVFSRTNLLPS